MNLAKDFYEYEYFDKFTSFYNELNRNISPKNDILTKSLFKNTLNTGDFTTNSLYLDDFVSPSSLLNTNSFAIFPLFSVFNYLEDSYESLKYLNHFYNVNNKIILNSLNNNFQPYSYFFVFDMFRADYEDFS
jgi:hypothetical protein